MICVGMGVHDAGDSQPRCLAGTENSPASVLVIACIDQDGLIATRFNHADVGGTSQHVCASLNALKGEIGHGHLPPSVSPNIVSI